MGMAQMPVYHWVSYNMHNTLNLGLKTQNEDVVAGTADIDIADEPTTSALVRKSSKKMVINWFDPTGQLTLAGVPISGGYRPFTAANENWSRYGTRLRASDLTWNGGEWMPVLEPVTTTAPNYAILGYAPEEVIWPEDDPRLNQGGAAPADAAGSGNGAASVATVRTRRSR